MMTNNKSGDVFLVVKAIDTPSISHLGLPMNRDKPLLKHMHGIYKHVTAFFKCFELIPACTRR